LRADCVPLGVEVLFPLANEWGLSDDADRSIRIESANVDDLRRLVEGVDSVDEAVLYGWLSGPESLLANPPVEYLAITCLTMAADEARATLGQLGAPWRAGIRIAAWAGAAQASTIREFRARRIVLWLR
jgi:hypothetical protein